MTKQKLFQTGELDLLEYIRKNFPGSSGSVIAGIGDDAAVLKPSKENLLVTTDMMVEGVHFDLRFTTPFQLGFKLISVNVSDIYAMGGIPEYALLDIALRKDAELSFLKKLLLGIKNATKLYNISLVGGDMSSANRDVTLSATVMGKTKRHILRSGAKSGDKIYVTGYLGDSACGLELLKKKGVYINTRSKLVRRHLTPVARNPENFSRIATAMIDISDGLLIDLTRLCNESGTGAVIYEEKIPVSRQMEKSALELGLSPIKLALTGGEDYELLFTAPPDKNIKAICIGDIVKSERVIIDRNKRKRKFTPEGYQHFGK